MAGWALLGRLEEQMEGKTADELKRMVAENAGDLKVGDVSRLRNAEKIKQKVLEAAAAHNLEEFRKNPSFLIRGLAGSESKIIQVGGILRSFAAPAYDGKERMEALGVNIKHYRSRDAAKQWYRNYSKIVHPDNNPNNSKALDAFNEIHRIYRTMID